VSNISNLSDNFANKNTQ